MSFIGYFWRLPTADQLPCQFRHRPILGLEEGEPLPFPGANLGQMRIINSHLLKFDERGSHDHISAQVGNDGPLDWDPMLHRRASQLTIADGRFFGNDNLVTTNLVTTNLVTTIW